MELVLKSGKSSRNSTIGELYVDDKFECYTLEDVVREISGQPPEKWKIHGKTAIPAGKYKVAITNSPKYGKPMPLLLTVPGFEGIRIHSGNSAQDTEGCILVGATRGDDWIGESRKAYANLFLKLEKVRRTKEPVTIEIQRAL